MRWERWNDVTHIFELSTDNGVNWNPLPLNASILNEGSISASLLSAAWPVGSIFISVVSTNPGTLLGFGTWAAFGAGRVLVGIDAGQTEFDTVEETGGEKTHQLTLSEIPSHSHAGSSVTVDIGSPDTTGESERVGRGRNNSVFANHAGALNMVAEGGNGAHNNLQPYIVVYMWKRTA